MEAQADPAPVDDGARHHLLERVLAERARTVAACGHASFPPASEDHDAHAEAELKIAEASRNTGPKRAPIVGLAALAWNAHLDAARLEGLQRGAMGEESQRLEREARRLDAEADRIEAATETRRLAILRAIGDPDDKHPDLTPHVHEADDGTHYVEMGPGD